MQKQESKTWKEKTKIWLFQCILIVNNCMISHKYLVLLMVLLQLSALQYFYINTNFTFLYNFSLIQKYYQILNTYFIYIVPFQNQAYSVLILCIYPFVLLVILLTKQFGPNKLFLMIIQVLNYLYPMISIKMVIALSNCLVNGKFLYIAIPFGLINLIYGALILYFSNRLHRLIQIPIIVSIQLGLNYYIIMPLLLIRLIILVYLFFPKHICMLSTYFELSLFLSLFLFLYGNDNMLHYCSLGALIGSFTFYGIWIIYREYDEKQDIYDRIDNLQENEEQLFQIIRQIQEHETKCEVITCRCHSYVSINDNQELKKFIYQYDEQRLKNRNGFNERVEYADRCIQKFQLRLSGVIKILQHKAVNIVQQYKIYRICRIYEDSLRKQDKNYHHGQAYMNIYEQNHKFSCKILSILKMIKQFWSLIVSFDGSTKFLSSILAISKQITELKLMYDKCMLKYDIEGVSFRHMMELFLAIILNQKMSDDDQLAVPQQVIFMITNQNKIINVNYNFANLVGTNIQHVINKGYTNFIPEVYRDVHRQWVEQFIDSVEKYQDKVLEKPFALGPIEIKMVQMQHRVLPRFMQGLEIFTKIVLNRQNEDGSFIFIVEKQTFFIKNVQHSFFQLCKFKLNQRNVKVLQELNLNSIFQNFCPNSGNSSSQTKIFSHFLEQFTYIKKKQQKKPKKTDQYHETTGVSRVRKAHNDADNVYEYQILKNVREQDPYIKILFKLQTNHIKVQQRDSTQSFQEIEQSNSEQQKNKSFVQKQISFFIPYYLVLVLIGIHVLFLQISKLFQLTFTTLIDKYKFYLAYDFTVLQSLNIFIGKNQVPLLQQLWIRGYGNFSESFNAFESISEPIFSTYFNQSMTTTFHNQLYHSIQNYLTFQIDSVKILGIGLLIILIVSLCHYLIDYFLNMRYIFKVENKVGQLLLQFVIIDETDIQKLINIIQNFITNILHVKESKNNKDFKLPIQTIEESAFQLMRGGSSLNNSAQIHSEQQTQLINDLRTNHARKRSAIKISETERVSLSIMKKQLKQIQQVKQNISSRFPKKNYEKSQSETDKSRTITIFKQNYGSVRYIFAENKRFFTIITVTMVVSCGMIAGLFFLIYRPTVQFQTRVNILQNMYESKIIMLKSLQQISINNYTLQPQNTVSLLIFDIIKDIKQLDNNEYLNDFNKTFHIILGQNTCHLVDASLCNQIKQYANLNLYGLNIITQYIQQYFRMKNISSIYTNNSYNNLILYQQALLDVLIDKFTGACISYNNQLTKYQMNLMIVGLLLCLICLIINHFSLKYYKNRIEDSSSLSKIIPKQIKDKHLIQLGNLNKQEEI